MIGTLGLIGVGLIGGSLARALRAAGYVQEIVGYGRTLANLDTATRLGIIDYAVPKPQDAVRNADVVMLAVPPGSMADMLAQIAPAVAKHAVITDVGSVKASVIRAARATLGARFPMFVPGHPIAGTEQSGAAASLVDLFQGRRVVLTPESDTDPLALARVRAMWDVTGAEVLTMTAVQHDRILAASSHLPHMLAYALVHALAGMDEHEEIFKYAAGGLRDFTRIAASDPLMWRDIALANRDPLLGAIRHINRELTEITQAIERGDGDSLLRIFERVRQARNQFAKRPDPCG